VGRTDRLRYRYRVQNDLTWDAQVEEAAKSALAEFRALQDEFDLGAVAREVFPTLVAEVDDGEEVIFFGWWLASRR
jgi:hypothetical protein